MYVQLYISMREHERGYVQESSKRQAMRPKILQIQRKRMYAEIFQRSTSSGGCDGCARPRIGQHASAWFQKQRCSWPWTGQLCMWCQPRPTELQTMLRL